MDVTVRELRESDVDAVNALHNDAFGKSRTAAQFRWEFMDGPYGPAVFVVGDHDGEIVGTHALIPVRLSRRGEILSAAKDEETLVAARLRGQGVAARLFATTSRLGAEKGVEISFGLSNSQANLRGKVRDGHSILGKVRYGVLVLNGAATNDLFGYWRDRHLGKAWRPLGALAFRGLLGASCGWGAARRALKSTPRTSGLEVEIVRHADGRFDEFASRYCRSAESFTVERSRAYVEWRVFCDPYSDNYGVLVLDAGSLVAYAAISHSLRNQSWALTDLCALPEYESSALALAADSAIDVAFDQRAACVLAWAGGRCNLQSLASVRALQASGFLFPGLGSTCHGKLMNPTESTRRQALTGFESLDNWYVTLLFSQGTM
jgi:hypothetical protein